MEWQPDTKESKEEMEDVADTKKPKQQTDKTPAIHFERSQVPQVPLNNIFSGDTASALSRLGVETYNAAEVEKTIIEQVDKAMAVPTMTPEERNKLVSEIEDLENILTIEQIKPEEKKKLKSSLASKVNLILQRSNFIFLSIFLNVINFFVLEAQIKRFGSLAALRISSFGPMQNCSLVMQDSSLLFIPRSLAMPLITISLSVSIPITLFWSP